MNRYEAKRVRKLMELTQILYAKSKFKKVIDLDNCSDFRNVKNMLEEMQIAIPSAKKIKKNYQYQAYKKQLKKNDNIIQTSTETR